MFKIEKGCCNEGGDIIEEGSIDAILYFLHIKSLRGGGIVANCLSEAVPDVQ